MESKPFDFSKLEGFEWDQWNVNKNWEKHKVDYKECEEIFINEPVRIFDDNIHSKSEKRYAALGKTNKGRCLVVFFTIRKKKIRIISARDQGQKDRKVYEETEKEFIKEREVKL